MKPVHFRSLALAIAAVAMTGVAAAQERPNALLNSLEVRQLVARAEPADNARLAAHFTVLADRYQGKRLNSPNDLVYRSDGTLYFTDPPFGLPKAFGDALLGIERALGRQRGERWAARTIDLDILWMSDVIVDEPGLHVPHPRLGERAFALLPLLDVAPDARDPGSGAPYAMLARGIDRAGVRVLPDPLRLPPRLPSSG